VDQSAKWENITSETLELGTGKNIFYIKTNDFKFKLKKKKNITMNYIKYYYCSLHIIKNNNYIR